MVRREQQEAALRGIGGLSTDIRCRWGVWLPLVGPGFGVRQTDMPVGERYLVPLTALDQVEAAPRQYLLSLSPNNFFWFSARRIQERAQATPEGSSHLLLIARQGNGEEEV